MSAVDLLTETKIQSITKQIFQGLAYLHAKGFVHRDIKPENLLIRGDTCKVADFGLAREVSSQYDFTEYVSTRWYRAPEVLLRSPRYGTPIDLFAVGCIIAELYCRLPLFSGDSETDQLYQMIQVLGIPDEETWPEGVRLSEKAGYSFAAFADELAVETKSIPPTPLEDKVRTASPRAIRLMKDLLDWNPEERPSANQALQNEYFSAPVSSPKAAPTTAITESAEKNRALKLVTASPGYWHPDPFDHSSPPPLAVERQPMGKKRPLDEESTLVHSNFSACDYGRGYWPDNAR
jgi:protein kinase